MQTCQSVCKNGNCKLEIEVDRKDFLLSVKRHIKIGKSS